MPRRGSNIITPQQWENIQLEVYRLYIVEDLPLKEVQNRLKRYYNFEASNKRWKIKLKEWLFFKNYNERILLHAARKLMRMYHRGKRRYVKIYGRRINEHDIMKRLSRKSFKKFQDLKPRLPSSPTPSAISCKTEPSTEVTKNHQQGFSVDYVVDDVTDGGNLSVTTRPRVIRKSVIRTDSAFAHGVDAHSSHRFSARKRLGKVDWPCLNLIGIPSNDMFVADFPYMDLLDIAPDPENTQTYDIQPTNEDLLKDAWFSLMLFVKTTCTAVGFVDDTCPFWSLSNDLSTSFNNALFHLSQRKKDLVNSWYQSFLKMALDCMTKSDLSLLLLISHLFSQMTYQLQPESELIQELLAFYVKEYERQALGRRALGLISQAILGHHGNVKPVVLKFQRRLSTLLNRETSGQSIMLLWLNIRLCRDLYAQDFRKEAKMLLDDICRLHKNYYTYLHPALGLELDMELGLILGLAYGNEVAKEHLEVSLRFWKNDEFEFELRKAYCKQQLACYSFELCLYEDAHRLASEAYAWLLDNNIGPQDYRTEATKQFLALCVSNQHQRVFGDPNALLTDRMTHSECASDKNTKHSIPSDIDLQLRVEPDQQLDNSAGSSSQISSFNNMTGENSAGRSQASKEQLINRNQTPKMPRLKPKPPPPRRPPPPDA